MEVMEVFTVEQHHVVPPVRRRRCRLKIPYVIALGFQMAITILLSALLLWDICAPDAAKDMLPFFGRLTLIICFIISFYSQEAIIDSEEEIPTGKLLTDLILFTGTILCGNTFWIIEMQYASGLYPTIANYTAIEPVIFLVGSFVAIYYLRRLMEFYYKNRITSEGGESCSSPLFAKAIIAIAVFETVFGLTFATLMSFVMSPESEFPKRCVCILALYLSSVINELSMALCKDGRRALFLKTLGFFVNLISTQFTWWLSYYKGSQLNLYGLGVGFLGLLFGVLYTLEMSLKVAQLNDNPGPMNGCKYKCSSSAGDGTGSVMSTEPGRTSTPMLGQAGQSSSVDEPTADKEPNSESVDASQQTESIEERSDTRIINRKCVVCLVAFLQICLGLLPAGVIITDIFNPITDVQKLNLELMGNWTFWAVGFFASILLNEIILFQEKVYYLLVSLCNGAYCINFCLGCVISYQGIVMSMGGNGIPINFIIVGSVWLPYFIIAHVHFVRLTRFSLNLEERQIRRSRDIKVTLFVASGIQSIIALAAFIPVTDFWHFPGKVFSILTFPSLTFIAEVVFYFGKKSRGPFLVTFTAFFLGTGYSQIVWYISVIMDEEGADDFLGLTKPWLFGLGVVMGVVAWIYIIRFIFVIVTKWEKRE